MNEHPIAVMLAGLMLVSGGLLLMRRLRNNQLTVGTYAMGCALAIAVAIAWIGILL